MSLLEDLSQNSPKKWIKQEIARLKKEIQDNQQLIKHHTIIRQNAGLVFSEQVKVPNDQKPCISASGKSEAKESWGVKLSYSKALPKKRGRSRKVDHDPSQTRIVFYRNT